MFLKAAFKNTSVVVQFLMILAVVAFCTCLFSFLGLIFIVMKTGISPEMVQSIANDSEVLRGMQFLQTLGIFIFPPIICAWLFSDNYKEYLQVDNPIYLPVAAWAVISVIVAVPFLNMTYYFNQQMVLPEAFKGLENWMREMEDMGAQVTEKLLQTKDLKIIIFNVLIICVLAGIGEEFMFRGLLQNLFGRFIRNPHVLIWTIAFLFSFIHLQFYGFIPRLLLGAWLGYLMYYTKTIWIPVLAHFTNNFFSVGMYYLFQDAPEKIQEADAIGSGSTWWFSIVSLALFVFCFRQIKKEVSV